MPNVAELYPVADLVVDELASSIQRQFRVTLDAYDVDGRAQAIGAVGISQYEPFPGQDNLLAAIFKAQGAPNRKKDVIVTITYKTRDAIRAGSSAPTYDDPPWMRPPMIYPTSAWMREKELLEHYPPTGATPNVNTAGELHDPPLTDYDIFPQTRVEFCVLVSPSATAKIKQIYTTFSAISSNTISLAQESFSARKTMLKDFSARPLLYKDPTSEEPQEYYQIALTLAVDERPNHDTAGALDGFCYIQPSYGYNQLDGGSPEKLTPILIGGKPCNVPQPLDSQGHHGDIHVGVCPALQKIYPYKTTSYSPISDLFKMWGAR